MYHYTESGLSNIWLKNGYEEQDTPWGPGVAIHDIDGLHRVIGTEIANRPADLSGEEFRFLRVELNLSQKVIAGMLGVTEQCVSLWERSKAKGRIPASASNMLRVLYKESINGTVEVRKLIGRLAELDKERCELYLELEEMDSGWGKAA